MTTVSGRLAHFGWPRLGGAIVLLAVVTACSPAAATPQIGATTSAGSSAPPAVTSGATAQASGAMTPAGPSASVVASPSDPATAASVLAAAIAPLRAASAFGTTVTVDGATVVTATGRSVGSSSMISVTTGDRTVEYIRIPPKAWARQAGGAWVLVVADSAPASPVDVLGAPTTVTGDSTGAGAVLEATYLAAALGLTGDPVKVTITIGSTAVRFSYTLTTSGKTTVSTTTLRPSPADPITAPAP